MMSAVTSQPGLTPVILPVRTIEPPATISPKARAALSLAAKTPVTDYPAPDLHVSEAMPHAGFGFGVLPENEEVSKEIRRFVARHG